MATYLAFVAAGRFRVEQGSYRGRPYYLAVSTWYDHRLQERSLRLLRQTPLMVAWLETQLGPYPFDSTGGVVTSLYPGFALENQSRPTYPYLGTGPTPGQRWCTSWRTSGSATRSRSGAGATSGSTRVRQLAEWRYAETHGGESAQHRLVREYAARPAGRAFWRLRVDDPGPAGCSTRRSTSGGRWRCRRCGTASAGRPSAACCAPGRASTGAAARRSRSSRTSPRGSAGSGWTGSSTPGCTPAPARRALRERFLSQGPGLRPDRSARWAAMADYRTEHARSIEDPEGYWGEQAGLVDWIKKPQRVLDDDHPPFYRWFPDATLNTCYNALDRHVVRGHGDRTALIYDSAVADTRRSYTYARLLERTAAFAGALRGFGVGAATGW